MERWIEETLHLDWRTRLKAERVLFESQTEHQHLVIFDNNRFGRVMMLDHIVQLTTADEFIYHEMMAHVPLTALEAVEPETTKSVLIIGGGDGGVLREVLRHPSVERAVLCEIDHSVIDMCKDYFPAVSDGAFDNPRAEIVIADGTEYVRQHKNSFDVIMVDSTDPIGPGAVLFTKEFYGDCQEALNEGGVMLTQNGLPFMQPEELKQSVTYFKELGFKEATAFTATTPGYFGGPMSQGWASKRPDLSQVDADLLWDWYNALDIKTRYYDPDVHRGAFALPRYIREIVE
jgi:spermidine synthase